MKSIIQTQRYFYKEKIVLYDFSRGKNMSFYVGLGMQLVGFSSVGLCLFAGLKNGDYGRLELIELIGGSLVFYVGTFLKNKGSK